MFNRKNKKNKDVNLVKLFPTKYSEAKLVSKELMFGNVVLVDVRNLPTHEQEKLVDFISGSIFVLNAKYKKISNSIFFLAPNEMLMEKYYDRVVMLTGK